MSRILATCFALLVFASFLPAQRGQMMREDPDYYPLGGIEAQGLVDRNDNRAGIVIKEVFPKGLAAKSGLLPDDIIVRVAGKKLPNKKASQRGQEVLNNHAVIDAFCALVEKAEAKKPSGKYGKLKIEVERSGESVKLELLVRHYGKHANDPARCKKTRKILEDALEFIEERQAGTGNQKHVSNQNHAVATAALCGLAWIGSGKKKYAKNITKAADFIMESAGKERDFGMRGARGGGANWNQTNWSLCYAAIFLSEYYAQKKRPAVKKRLSEIIKKIEENQEQSGGWAHGPGGPNALGYLELEIMSNLALGGMGMAQRVGVQLDDAKAIKGYHYMKACTQGGGVSYSPKPGQFGHGDPGRTAGAHWALSQLGKGKDLRGSMAKFYTRDLEKLYEGHACPTMHVWNGALCSSLLGKKAYGRYFKHWRAFVMASRTRDGAFGYRPNQESAQMRHHADRTWGPSFVTAHYIVSLQLGQGRFKLLDTLPSSR